MAECPVCGKEFGSNKALVQHTESTHGRAGVYRGVLSWEKSRKQRGAITTGAAPIDYNYYVDSSNYLSDSDTWECGMCYKEFSSERQLEQHLNSGVHEQKRYECQECNKKMSSLAALTQHLEATGHARKESRLVDVMLTDARQTGLQMITNGSARRMYHECTLYFDGSAPSNPCYVGGCGWHLVDHHGNGMVSDGETVYPMHSYEHVTNNLTEYCGLIGGLKAAIDEGVKRLKVHGDSELVIKHMTGQYNCNYRLRPLYDEAKDLEDYFQNVDYEWIPRDMNKVADKLSKQFARD